MKTLLTLCLAIAALPGLADTQINYVDEASGEAETQFFIKSGKVRMNDPAGDSYTLFDRSTGMLTIVDESEQTYTEMDEAAMEDMSGQVSDAMKQVREQMEQMPPEQRQVMERMMGGALEGGKSMFDMNVERTGEELNRAGYECDQVFFEVGSLARTELCVVDPQDIDMPDEDRRALNEMQDQMRAMAEKMTQSLGVNFTFDFDSLGGLPVYMKEEGAESAQVLKNISHDRLADELFEIPEGYRKDELNLE